MDDEAAFLAAMHGDPASRLTRHAYADWLEERGDPRHELVRVCEAMRTVPVWSDDYWRLKARRNELWTRYPIEWLEATGYDGSDYDPIFRDGVPDGVRERWRLIREFTERWHGVSVPDVGGRRDVIAREEARLGLTLPESVRELIAFAHDVGNQVPLAMNDGNQRPRFLSDVGRELQRSPTDGLSFLGVDGNEVGVAKGDLRLADPPVYDNDVHQAVEAGPIAATTTSWMFQQSRYALVPNYSLDGYAKAPDAYLRRLTECIRLPTEFCPNLFETTGLLVIALPDVDRMYVSIFSRQAVKAAQLPACLFEDDPIVGYPSRSNQWPQRSLFGDLTYDGQPEGSVMGLTRQRWDERRDEMQHHAESGRLWPWLSVLRRSEAARTTAAGEPRA